LVNVNDEEEEKERSLQYFQRWFVRTGSQSKIVTGNGDVSAAQFYSTVKAVISFYDPCRAILLNMTYKVWPLVITV
jgi:hypothetical protein